MQRFLPAAAIGAIAAVVVAGAAWLAIDDGPFAFKIRSHEVSQQSVDEELRELAESKQLDALVAQGGGASLSSTPGSTSVQYSAGWVSLRVAQELAAQTVERRGFPVTGADRRNGRELAMQSIGGSTVFQSLPDWFRQRLVHRWTTVAVLERDLLKNPTESLNQAVKAQCPSGKYVSHILVATESEAAAIQSLITGGTDFTDLARTRSTDPGSASVGGELGCLDSLQSADPTFLDAATNQPIGVVSDPVRTQFGYHLILVTDQPSASDLSAVGVDAVFRDVTVGANVEVDPRYGEWDKKHGQVLPPVAPSE